MATTVEHHPIDEPKPDVVWTARPDPDVVRGCGYCDSADCVSFEHERAARANETSVRTVWDRPFPGTARARNFSARRAAA